MKLNENSSSRNSRGNSEINIYLGVGFLLINFQTIQFYVLKRVWMAYLKHSLKSDLWGR